MEEKVYVVTLYRRSELEEFYADMESMGFRLALKRPLSRNTHYWMTEQQAFEINADERVWGVEAEDSFKFQKQAINNQPYIKSGIFWKGDTQPPATVSSNDLQWGHLHVAGNQAQRNKGQYGSPIPPWTYEKANDIVEVFNDGSNVDVVIVDDPVSYDCAEWESELSPGYNRFVQYQWFDNLNILVNIIDDDSQLEPTGTITYHSNANNPNYHGNHVTGTACGKHYGWAKEANIYNLAVTESWPSGQSIPALLIFDYLRAFHETKSINPITGFKNPTITNHSYGGIVSMPNDQPLQFGDLNTVYYQGVLYDINNPGPSGWTESGVEADFGIRFNLVNYPGYSSAVAADVQDAISEGIVIIGAAGNENLLMAEPGDSNWNNYINVNGVGSFYYNRGAWPNTPDSGAINVAALSNQGDFRRSTYSNFGPGVNVFAPGDNILSAYGSTGGLTDLKYGGDNYYNAISGTSMASPQVTGLITCLAAGKERITNSDVINYLQQFSIDDDMTFDIAGGGLDDNSCSQGSPNKYLHLSNPRPEIGYIKQSGGFRSTKGIVYGLQANPKTTYLTFPRQKSYYRPLPPPPPQIYSISVINVGSSVYQLTGSDRNGNFTNSSNKSIVVNQGDLLEFTVNASGHPFWIKTAPQTGTGFVVDVNTTNNNGSDVGTITWDTTNVTPGTYYYICQFHSGMIGSITVS